MIENLLIGFSYERPGGLLLSILYFIGASSFALILGVVYCYVCATFRHVGWIFQFVSMLFRGVPLLLLVFLCAHIPGLSIAAAGMLALVVYSLTHVGEILRGFMNNYPQYLIEQSRVMGLNYFIEWVTVRTPWVVSKSLPAILTHWVSLLKDTSALIVVSIGELATVAKSLGESSRQFNDWVTVLLVAACFYFLATMLLVRTVEMLGNKLLTPDRPDKKVFQV